MEFCILKNPVYFINLKHISKERLMFFLNQILFYQINQPEFLNFHFNQNDEETSMLISEESLQNQDFIESLDCIRKYSCACINNTYDYIDDTGLVKTLSTKFGEENIPILYITTLNNNFILFDHDHHEKSLQILNSLTKFVFFSPV